MVLLSFLLASLLTSSASTLNADEREIIEAAVKYAHLEPADATAVLSDRHLPLWELTQTLGAAGHNPRDFTRIDMGPTTIPAPPDANTHLLIADELVASLRAANRKSVSLKNLTTIHRTKERPDRISRPGISRDGLSALFVASDWAGGGEFLYLEKRDGRWQVVAIGPVWMV